jgi:hypothetical protein
MVVGVVEQWAQRNIGKSARFQPFQPAPTSISRASPNAHPEKLAQTLIGPDELPEQIELDTGRPPGTMTDFNGRRGPAPGNPTAGAGGPVRPVPAP